LPGSTVVSVINYGAGGRPMTSLCNGCICPLTYVDWYGCGMKWW